MSELTRFRARLETFADKYTPGQRALDLRDAMRRGYEDERHFRLAWELRNDVEHGGSATTYMLWSSALEDELPVHRWTIDVRAAIAGHPADKRWAGVGRLWAGVSETCDVQTLAAMTYAFMEVTFATYVLSNRERIEEARVFLQLLVEEVHEVGAAPMVAKLKLEVEQGAHSIGGLDVEAINEQDIEFAGQIVEQSAAIRKRWDDMRALRA